MVRWVKVLLIFFFFFGRSSTGRWISFLIKSLLPDRRILGVDWGGSKSNMSTMVSIGSSSACVTSLDSFKRRFCYCFFNYSMFPIGRVILMSFKVIFFSRAEPFLTLMWSFAAYFVLGVAYRWIPLTLICPYSLIGLALYFFGCDERYVSLLSKNGACIFLQFKFCLNSSTYAKTSWKYFEETTF